jgi:hypothetical protein
VDLRVGHALLVMHSLAQVARQQSGSDGMMSLVVGDGQNVDCHYQGRGEEPRTKQHDGNRSGYPGYGESRYHRSNTISVFFAPYVLVTFESLAESTRKDATQEPNFAPTGNSWAGNVIEFPPLSITRPYQSDRVCWSEQGNDICDCDERHGVINGDEGGIDDN